MNTLSFASLTFLVILLTLTRKDTAVEAARRSTHFAAAVRNPANYHRLHQKLSIGDDPREDIRTNILLNMEGI